MRLKGLLKKYNIEPDLVSLDQCFMIDEEILNLMVKSARLNYNDIVLEIGAGTGILTNKIAKYVKRVIAIEKDPRMYEILSSMLSRRKNVEIVIGNATKLGFFDANKIVSNLPYNVVEWFFKRLNKYSFDLAVVTIPLKFFERKKNDYNRLKMELIKVVEPSSFYPQPKIKSALVRVNEKL